MKEGSRVSAYASGSCSPRVSRSHVLFPSLVSRLLVVAFAREARLVLGSAHADRRDESASPPSGGCSGSRFSVEGWFAVATAHPRPPHLAGSCRSGGATAAAFELTLLRRAGFAAGAPRGTGLSVRLAVRSAAFAPGAGRTGDWSAALPSTTASGSGLPRCGDARPSSRGRRRCLPGEPPAGRRRPRGSVGAEPHGAPAPTGADLPASSFVERAFIHSTVGALGGRRRDGCRRPGLRLPCAAVRTPRSRAHARPSLVLLAYVSGSLLRDDSSDARRAQASSRQGSSAC